MSKKIAGLFPGQGSQSVGMGKAFYDSSEEARSIFEIADKTLGFSLSKLCLEGPIEELTLTAHTQPALLLISYISWRMSKVRLAVACGHSLGEYSAHVVAETISFTDAIELVYKRGRYMQEAVPVGLGAMVAVMKSSEDEISTVLNSIDEGIAEIANLNCPGQTVVAGEAKAIAAFSEKMKEAGGKIIPLNVSAPFHCSLMTPARDNLARDLDATTFNTPKIPVYANFTAKQITSTEEARELLKKQVCGTVRWTDSINNLISEQQPEHCIEFGPGGVLTKLLKRINKTMSCAEIYDPETALQVVSKIN